MMLLTVAAMYGSIARSDSALCVAIAISYVRRPAGLTFANMNETSNTCLHCMHPCVGDCDTHRRKHVWHDWNMHLWHVTGRRMTLVKRRVQETQLISYIHYFQNYESRTLENSASTEFGRRAGDTRLYKSFLMACRRGKM